MARLDPGFGLVVLDPRLEPERLTAKGVGLRDSAYTEDAPQPGVPAPVDPASTWRPVASRAQTVGLTVYSIRAGFAEGREGAEILYRLASDLTDNDYRSWQDPVIVSQFSSGLSSGATNTWGGALAWDTVGACATPDGVIVITAVDDSLGTGQTWKFDTRTGLWSDGKIWTALGPGLEGPIGMVYDEQTERAILYSGTDLGVASALQQVAFASLDEGATFVPFGRRTLGGAIVTGTDQGAIRVASRPDLDWLMFVLTETNGTGIATQLASSDHGATYQLVDNCDNANTGLWPVRTAAGGFLVAYVKAATGEPCVRLLASARAKFDDAAEIIVDATRDAKLLVPVVDHDGVIYLYAQGTATPVQLDELALYRSLNGGISWERFDCDVYGGGSTITEWYEWNAAVAVNGAVYLIGVGIGHAETDGTIGVLRLGGWEQVAHNGGALGTIATHKRRFGYGGAVGLTAIQARSYFPIAYPDALGWVALGGTAAITLSVGNYEGLRILANASQTRQYEFTATVIHTSVAMEAEIIVDDGSTRAALLANTGPHITVRLSDASTYEYEVIVHLGNDGIALEDANSGGTIESVPLNMGVSSGGARLWTRIKLQLTAGRVDWWYRQGYGDLAPVWTKGVGGSVTNGAAATLSRCTFGVAGTNPSTTPVYFRHVGVAFGGGWSYGIEALAEYERRYSDGYRGHLFGRPIPGRGLPYPVPELTNTSGTIGRISAAGGPTYLGEIVQIPVGYDQPITAVHPTRSPSPRAGWRATGTAETKLVYDLLDPRWFGDALALFVARARPAQWVLETDDGGAGWTVHGTLDLTVASGLSYTRTGRVLEKSGITVVGRYFRENELAGGYVTSGGVAAVIAEHSAGWWGGVNRQQIRLTLEAVGTFPAAGGDLAIVAPSGLLVVYLTSSAVRRYVRIRAAAATVVPDGKYQAGILALGRVVGVGDDPAWTWSNERRLAVRRSRSSDGVSSARELGPPARAISYQWPDLVDTGLLRGAADHVAPAAGLPIGARGDAAALPELFSAVDSGEVPVIVVPRLPLATATLLDREAFVYGRLAMDAWGVRGANGKEGTDEIVAIGALTVDELV